MTVPGGGCRSLGCRGYLRALLDARISLGTTTRLHRHLPQAHLLAMSSTNELIKFELSPRKISKADVSSVSTSSERIEESWGIFVLGVEALCQRRKYGDKNL